MALPLGRRCPRAALYYPGRNFETSITNAANRRLLLVRRVSLEALATQR
jgi:hypothetical protein